MRLAILATSLAILTAAAAVTAAPPADLDTYVLFGIHGIRTKGVTAANGDLGAGDAALVASGSIQAPQSALVGDVARFRVPSTCASLFANEAPSATCATPQAFGGPVITDPADACGFEIIPSCAARPGAHRVVARDGVVTISPGDHGNIRVEQGARLHLRPGRYHLCSLQLDREARLVAEGPVRLDVADFVDLGDESSVARASTAGARDVRIYLAGQVMKIQRDATVTAEVCAPDGTLAIKRGAQLRGRFVARLIRTDMISARRSYCGDNAAEGLEECDGADIAPCSGDSAATAFVDNCPVCRRDCTADRACCAIRPTTTTVTSTSTTIATTTTTTEPPACNHNGIREGAEECDGDDLGGRTCPGSAGGALLDAGCPVCTAQCTVDLSCCPPLTTTTTLPVSNLAICGDCIDNDSDSLTDFQDDECCEQQVSTTLKRGKIRPRGGGSRLQLRGRMTGPFIQGLDPTREGLQVQVADQHGRILLCAQVPAGRFVANHKKHRYRFRDKRRLEGGAKGIDGVSIRVSKTGAVRFVIRAKRASFATPSAEPLTVTLGFRDPAGQRANRCAPVRASFRLKKTGALVFK